VTRGDIFRIRLAKGAGREQHGERFAVVLQTDQLLALSTVIVAPTSRSAQPASFRPQIDLGGTPTRVLIDQLRAVDHRRLGKRAGRIDPAERRSIDEAIELVLDLV
jgi:mRNA interferase MazF